jgi:tRNA dimethylallyltransferase
LKKDKKLIVIAGPTASGKTTTAIEIARQLQTEIVSADSRQVFREMTIGTAKPSAEELAQIKHHFIDILSIAQDYDAAQFGNQALTVINEILRINNYAILCGGSGLYIKAVCEGFDEIPEVDDEIRDDLIRNFEKHGIAWLQQRMMELDPEHYAKIDQQNPHRLMRALEVRIGTGASISTFRKSEKTQHDFEIVKIGLELPREILYKRIDDRMDEMIGRGLFEEAKRLYSYNSKNALQTVGYQEIFGFMDGLYDYSEAVRLLKRNSRRYAKRQLTWFKRDEEMRWFSPEKPHDILEYVLSR